MTDSRGPPQRGLCFLSTLLSQKVPEKSDTVLRCMISGQPKPEVTWYKNGQTIEECGIISSYEFFQNQYIHMLHLYCCTQDDAAVYQVSARNGQGMICCSASLEVERPTTLPDPGAPETRPVDCEKAPPNEAQARTSWAAPGSADPPSSQSHGLAWGQSLANGDLSASSTDHPRGAEATRQTEELVHGQLRPESSPASVAQDGHRPSGSAPRPISGVQEKEALSHAGPSHAAFSAAPPNPRAEKYISFSLPLPPPPPVTAESGTLGQPAACSKHPSPRLPSEDSDSDYELCPEITFTYTEKFSDDDLEYLECSDVMTDYSNAIWQRSLQGAERVFLLESDDEEPEFSERGLEG
ncbi:alpha-protein kinase 2-like, partial [Sorex fumeus]|uniref:alpha-protein kinase 2-like n=1 Tax=Sorex fumeus TaxID=62283 RepID=UPI0024ADF73C